MKWSGEQYKCRNCGEIYPYSLSKCNCGGVCDKIADASPGSSTVYNSGQSILADILESEKQKEQDEFENELARLYDAVKEACNKSDYATAISHLEKILAITPDSQDAKDLLSYCKNKTEQTREVISQIVHNVLVWCENKTEQTNQSQKNDIANSINAQDMFNYALNCYNGNGVPQNYKEAAKFFRIAAEKGHALAQYWLGNCYSKGNGVDQSYTEAVNWYRKAAEQGEAKGQNKLGKYYYYGWGVPRNKTEAIKWLQKAANQGNEDAKKLIMNCESELREQEIQSVFGNGFPFNGKGLNLNGININENGITINGNGITINGNGISMNGINIGGMNMGGNNIVCRNSSVHSNSGYHISCDNSSVSLPQNPSGKLSGDNNNIKGDNYGVINGDNNKLYGSNFGTIQGDNNYICGDNTGKIIGDNNYVNGKNTGVMKGDNNYARE